ncbi:MAG: hypothetical protein HFJ75_03765 [Eggerthellaceae bacterium]|nr:hypothetical protein [Eggerthellaceae bacterium]
MCETCNLMCGKCKPAQLCRVLCPACGTASLVAREMCIDALGRPRAGRTAGEAPPDPTCRGCGASLRGALEEILQPQPCRYSGIVCGYPCGRRHEERREGDRPCRTQVPLARLE